MKDTIQVVMKDFYFSLAKALQKLMKYFATIGLQV